MKLPDSIQRFLHLVGFELRSALPLVTLLAFTLLAIDLFLRGERFQNTLQPDERGAIQLVLLFGWAIFIGFFQLQRVPLHRYLSLPIRMPQAICAKSSAVSTGAVLLVAVSVIGTSFGEAMVVPAVVDLKSAALVVGLVLGTSFLVAWVTVTMGLITRSAVAQLSIFILIVCLAGVLAAWTFFPYDRNGGGRTLGVFVLGLVLLALSLTASSVRLLRRPRRLLIATLWVAASLAILPAIYLVNVNWLHRLGPARTETVFLSKRYFGIAKGYMFPHLSRFYLWNHDEPGISQLTVTQPHAERFIRPLLSSWLAVVDLPTQESVHLLYNFQHRKTFRVPSGAYINWLDQVRVPVDQGDFIKILTLDEFSSSGDVELKTLLFEKPSLSVKQPDSASIERVGPRHYIFRYNQVDEFIVAADVYERKESLDPEDLVRVEQDAGLSWPWGSCLGLNTALVAVGESGRAGSLRILNLESGKWVGTVPNLQLRDVTCRWKSGVADGSLTPGQGHFLVRGDVPGNRQDCILIAEISPQGEILARRDLCEVKVLSRDFALTRNEIVHIENPPEVIFQVPPHLKVDSIDEHIADWPLVFTENFRVLILDTRPGHQHKELEISHGYAIFPEPHPFRTKRNAEPPSYLLALGKNRTIELCRLWDTATCWRSRVPDGVNLTMEAPKRLFEGHMVEFADEDWGVVNRWFFEFDSWEQETKPRHSYYLSLRKMLQAETTVIEPEGR